MLLLFVGCPSTDLMSDDDDPSESECNKSSGTIDRIRNMKITLSSIFVGILRFLILFQSFSGSIVTFK